MARAACSMSRSTLTSALTWVYLCFSGRHRCRSRACRHRRGPRAAQRHCAAKTSASSSASSPKVSGSGHFGCRLAFGRDKLLFVTLGERQQWPAQDHGHKRSARSCASRATAASRPTTRPRCQCPPRHLEPGAPQPRAPPSPRHRRALGGRARPWQGGDRINIARAGANYGWPWSAMAATTVTRWAMPAASVAARTRRASWSPSPPGRPPRSRPRAWPSTPAVCSLNGAATSLLAASPARRSAAHRHRHQRDGQGALFGNLGETLSRHQARQRRQPGARHRQRQAAALTRLIKPRWRSSPTAHRAVRSRTWARCRRGSRAGRR